MNPASSDTTPSEMPADPSGSAGRPTEIGEVDFDWTVIISLVHPLKVAIIEALRCIGRPLSASNFCAPSAIGTSDPVAMMTARASGASDRM